MRVLVVTNLHPDGASPHRGRWVRDQVTALRSLGIEVELYSFPAGRKHYAPAIRGLRRHLRRSSFDLVHAHYGLAGWCALAAGAKPLAVTFHGTDVRHRLVGPMSRALSRRIRLVAGVSLALFEPEAERPGLPRIPGRSAVLPCGPDLDRFGRIDRNQARERLGLDPVAKLLLFPADPLRPVKRHDRAALLAERLQATLLTGGGIDPADMPLWVNAADAVLVTSEYEGFGLACLEALACDVPVLSTPVGIAPHALAGIEGCLCEPFDVESWARLASRHLNAEDPRVKGSESASRFAADRMACRVMSAYEEILGKD